MRRTRVKICGLTRPEDARLATALGADAIGLVFVLASRRCVSMEQAVAICAAVSGLTRCVGLFMDHSAEQVARVIEQVPLDMLQFHGSEDEAYCAAFGLPYLKALPYAQAKDLADAFPTCAAIVVDGHETGSMGGGGRAFDWSCFPSDSDRPLILAGGLEPANVGRAIRRLRPYAVDVSSGVEAGPGVKDSQRLERFFMEVHSADCEG